MKQTKLEQRMRISSDQLNTVMNKDCDLLLDEYKGVKEDIRVAGQEAGVTEEKNKEIETTTCRVCGNQTVSKETCSGCGEIIDCGYVFTSTHQEWKGDHFGHEQSKTCYFCYFDYMIEYGDFEEDLAEDSENYAEYLQEFIDQEMRSNGENTGGGITTEIVLDDYYKEEPNNWVLLDEYAEQQLDNDEEDEEDEEDEYVEQNDEYWCNLDNKLAEEGKYEEAEKVIRKALELNPNNPDYWCNLDYDLANQGKHEEAERAIKKAIELNDKDPIYWNNLYFDLSAQEKNSEAEQAISKAIELDPKDSDHWNNLNVILLDQKKFDEAEKAIRKAIELNDKDPIYWMNLGETLIGKNQVIEAKEALQRSNQLQPRDWEYAEELNKLIRQTVSLTRKNKVDPEDQSSTEKKDNFENKENEIEKKEIITKEELEEGLTNYLKSLDNDMVFNLVEPRIPESEIILYDESYYYELDDFQFYFENNFKIKLYLELKIEYMNLREYKFEGKILFDNLVLTYFEEEIHQIKLPEIIFSKIQHSIIEGDFLDYDVIDWDERKNKVIEDIRAGLDTKIGEFAELINLEKVGKLKIFDRKKDELRKKEREKRSMEQKLKEINSDIALKKLEISDLGSFILELENFNNKGKIAFFCTIGKAVEEYEEYWEERDEDKIDYLRKLLQEAEMDGDKTYKTFEDFLEVEFENLTIIFNLLVHHPDYLRNNITHFDENSGELQMNIEVKYNLEGMSLTIKSFDKQVGSYTWSEDAQDCGDGPEIDFNNNMDTLLEELEDYLVLLPEEVEIEIPQNYKEILENEDTYDEDIRKEALNRIKEEITKLINKK